MSTQNERCMEAIRMAGGFPEKLKSWSDGLGPMPNCFDYLQELISQDLMRRQSSSFYDFIMGRVRASLEPNIRNWEQQINEVPYMDVYGIRYYRPEPQRIRWSNHFVHQDFFNNDNEQENHS